MPINPRTSVVTTWPENVAEIAATSCEAGEAAELVAAEQPAAATEPDPEVLAAAAERRDGVPEHATTVTRM